MDFRGRPLAEAGVRALLVEPGGVTSDTTLDRSKRAVQHETSRVFLLDGSPETLDQRNEALLSVTIHVGAPAVLIARLRRRTAKAAVGPFGARPIARIRLEKASMAAQSPQSVAVKIPWAAS